MSPLARRLVWNVLPAGLVVSLVYLAVFGEHGLLARQRIQQDLRRTQRQLQSIQADNARLLREIDQLRNDPVSVERAAAEELLRVPPGSTVYRFADVAPAP